MPSRVDLLGVVRGDTLLRLIPMTKLDPLDPRPNPNDRARIPLTAAEIDALAAQYTSLELQLRERAGEKAILLQLRSEDGELSISSVATTPDSAVIGGLLIQAAASKMANLERGGVFDIQFTDPRPGHPMGPLITTWVRGTLTVEQDITR